MARWGVVAAALFAGCSAESAPPGGSSGASGFAAGTSAVAAGGAAAGRAGSAEAGGDAGTQASTGGSSAGSMALGGAGGAAIGGSGGAMGAGDASGGAGATGAGGAAGAAGSGAVSGAGAAAGAGSEDLAVVYLAEWPGPDMVLVPIMSGGSVQLVVPPQGGHVLFIGARLANVHGMFVKLHARLLNPDDGSVATEEMRTVALVPVAGSSTMFETDNSSLTQVSNITTCPDYAPRSIVGQPYALEMTVTEVMVPSPRQVVFTTLVIPSCPTTGPDAAFCACECSGGFAMGKCPSP